MNENFIDLLSKQKILPIIRHSNKQEVINNTKALLDAGIRVVEINVESPLIYEAIEELSKDAIVCAGGIITSLQAQVAIEAGAKYLSSPIFQMNLVKLSKDKKLPYIAGTSTANEAYQAWKSRIPLVKIYPVTALGGDLYIKNLLRPMPFLNVIPQGDVKLSEVRNYINAGAVAVGIGRNIFEGSTYNEITNRVKTTLDGLGVK